MENNEIALKLVLDAIEEDPGISTVNDRIRLQKAIYLAQECGIPLGYYYSWYVKGPYSPGLTQDYYSMNSALASGDNDTKGLTLHPSFAVMANAVRELLGAPPQEVSKHTWYEALGSLHYLVKSSKKSVADAKRFMLDVKPHIREDVLDFAVDRLHQRELIKIV